MDENRDTYLFFHQVMPVFLNHSDVIGTPVLDSHRIWVVL